MSIRNNNESIVELQETIEQLSSALANSERRHQAGVQVARWVATAVMVVVCGLVYLGSDLMAKAYAVQERAMPMMNTQQLMQMFGTVMQHAGQIAARESHNYAKCVEEKKHETDLCYAKTTVEDLGQYLLDAEGNPLPEEKMQNGIMMATAQVMVDSAALLHRVRRDSDFFRKVMIQSGGPTQLLAGIRDQLGIMNNALVVMPTMAANMDLMNRNMASMTYSMGSTMGRMGNIMPW